MKAILRIFPLILSLLWWNGGFAQHKRFLSMSTADGLPQNSVECFAQDSAGFLWIGTQDGLARYDGYRMEVFRNDPADRTSLSDNFVTALHIDRDGDLWVGTRNGFNLYDPLSNGFYKFWPDSNKLHQQVFGFRAMNDGRFAVRTVGMIYTVDKTRIEDWKNELASSAAIALYREQPVLDIYSSPDGWMILLDNEQLTFQQGDKEQVFPLDRPWPSVQRTMQAIIPCSVGWLVLNQGLYLFDPELPDSMFRPIYLPEMEGVAMINSVTAIGEELWVCTGSGLYILDGNDPSRVLEHYTHDPDNPFSLSYDFLHGAFQDREGRVWVGAANKGLNIYDPLWGRLHYLTHQPGKKDLPNPLVWTSYKDRASNLWVGTGEGIALYQHFDPEHPDQAQVSWPEKLRSLESVRSIIEAKDGLLWIASGRSGLYSYDPHSQALEHWNASFDLSNEMVSLAQDDLGRVWAGSYAGLFVVHPERRIVERLDSEHTTSSYIMSVKHVEDGVQVCHSSGYYVYADSRETEEVFRTTFNRDVPGSLPFSIVSSAVSVGNELWVGMYDKGVAILDAFGQFDRPLGETEGLSGHVVESMITDRQDRVWIATNQGLSCVDPMDFSVFNIGTTNGLRNQEFALDAAMMDADGWLYFGSVDGLLYFHPDHVLSSSSVTDFSVQLCNVSVNYTDYRSAGVTFANERLATLQTLELNPGEKVISFEFSAMNFTRARDVKYHYRMVGFDPDWVSTTADQRIATYSNLPAGFYEFEVRAKFADGAVAAAPLKLQVNVLPPFYETWWFRLSAIAFVLLTVAGAVRYISYRKYRKQLQELETRQRVQHERERISRDLHDNVGSQITYMISSLDNLAFQNSHTGNSGSSDQINDLGDFARGTMQQLREAIWVINKDQVSLAEFRLKLEEYCHKLLSSQPSLEWQVTLKGEDQKMLQPGSVLHLFRICQEAINNIMKHAEASQVQIRIEGLVDKVKLSIVDDGVGFDANARKNGHYGLDNMVERAKQMGGNIEWKSQSGSGTTVQVELE